VNKNLLIRKSWLFKSDMQLNHKENNVKNVVLNTDNTRIVQPMAWNITTAGERIIPPKFAEAVPL